MQGSKTLKRIKNQLKQIEQNPPLYWRVVKINDLQWVVWMDADDFSPFYGIPIKVHVKFPEKYPFSKPEITLDNFKIFFHANIHPTSGYICHKIVQSDQLISIRQRIEALRNLFSTPNFDSAYNTSAGNVDEQRGQLKKHKKLVQKSSQNFQGTVKAMKQIQRHQLIFM